MLKSILVASLMATAAVAEPLSGKAKRQFKCGNENPSPKQLAAMKQFSIQEAASGPLAARDTIDVDVYMHVVAISEDDDGYLSQDDVDAHFNALNSAYTDSNFQFTLQDTDWTVNETWANGDEQLAMKKELRKGSYKTLNIYFTKEIGDDLVGQCTFPDDVEKDTDDYYADGCRVIDNDTSTTVHETGHWFGLLHTFTDGCGGDGDHIDDTPPCKKTFDCPKDSDTCPDDDEYDPIHNWMGYNDCVSEFTDGQHKRMKSQWDSYRA